LAGAATLAFSQSATTSYSTDINGNRVAGPSTVSIDGQHTQIIQSINGHKVPMEQTDEKILSQTPNGRVVEKITKRFDPQGNLAETNRTVTEEEKLSDGSRSHSTLYRGDINGQFHEAERVTVESHTQGSTQNTQTELVRPDLSGSFQVMEKKSQVTETANKNVHTDETTYRRGQDGGFYPAVRDISDTTQSGQQMVTKAAHYENGGASQLQLRAQTETTTVKRPDGTTVSEVSLYGINGDDGRARENGAAPHLREKQTVELIPGPGGSMTQVVTAQRPSISDPERMGPVTKISETVCTGKCSGAAH
jgi:hypothetical protein